MTHEKTAHRRRQRYRVRGATMVEAAMTIGIFFLLILIFIDSCRIFFVYIGLELAAFRGVDLASKREIEIMTDADRCDPTGQPSAVISARRSGCAAYITRVEAIVKKATEFAYNFARPSTSDSGGVRLTRFRHYDQSTYSQASGCGPLRYLDAVEGDAAFLRPGEAVKIVSGPNMGTAQDTVTYPNSTFCGWPSGGKSWNTLLQEDPLMVWLEADYSPLTPLIPNIRIVAQQFAYRNTRRIASSAPIVPPAPGSTPLPTPTPSPIYSCPDGCNADPDCDPENPPTPTSSATVTPTPTDTATNTTTPTATRTPASTSTPTNTFAPCDICRLDSSSPACVYFPSSPSSCWDCTMNNLAGDYCWNQGCCAGLPTRTITPTYTVTPTRTPTITATATNTGTPPTSTPTLTRTATRTPTNTRTITPTATITLTPTVTRTPTLTTTPTTTPSPTETHTPGLPTAVPTMSCADCGNPITWCFHADANCRAECCGKTPVVQ